MNGKDEGGRTPLHWGARRDHEDVAILLLSKGADVNVRDEDGETPVLIARQRRDKEFVELLKQHGATE